MDARRVHFGVLALLLMAAVGMASLALPTEAQAAVASPGPSRDPSFLIVENAGQLDPAVRYQARAGTHTLWVTKDSLWLTWLGASGLSDAEYAGKGLDPTHREHPGQGVHLQLTFPSQREGVRLVPSDPQATRMNYLLGSDPNRWRSGVRTYGAVTWRDLYPGLSLTLTETLGGPSLIVQPEPGTGLAVLRLRVDGAESLRVVGGRLVAETAIGSVPLLPVLHEGGPIEAHVRGREASLTVPGPGAALPAAAEESETRAGKGLMYGTFLGGGAEDTPADVAVGEDGSTYVTGSTFSADFPTTPGAFDTTYEADWDVFVSKLDPTGSTLAYSTFLGGESAEIEASLEVGSDGSVYLAGRTSSPDFPTTPGAFDRTFDPGNGFVTRLEADGGALVYSTFLGIALNMGELALAPDGGVHVTGETNSPDYPTTPGAFDQTFNGFKDAFLTALNPAGSDLVYSTFLGGSSNDYGFGVTVGPDGSAYVTGETQSFDFPTTPGAFDETGGGLDGFVTRFDPTGSSLAFSTYLGGGDEDVGRAIALNPSGNVHVVGETSSPDFPTTPGAYDTTLNSFIFCDAFATTLDPTGSTVLASTYFGGNEHDAATDLAVEPDGSLTLAGETWSANLPTTPWGFDRTLGGSGDAFVARFDPALSVLAYGSFLGGTARIADEANAIAAAGPGSVTVVGTTNSGDFPVTPRAFDPTYNGGGDGFVATLRVAPTIHVERIVPRYRPAGWGYRVGAAIQIAFPDGSPVEGAEVTMEIAYPDGTEVVATDSTGPRGIAAVARPASDSGTYTFTVLDVARTGAVYDASQNAETTDSVTIPGSR